MQQRRDRGVSIKVALLGRPENTGQDLLRLRAVWGAIPPPFTCIRAAFPDSKWTVDEQIAEGDKAVRRPDAEELALMRARPHEPAQYWPSVCLSHSSPGPWPGKGTSSTMSRSKYSPVASTSPPVRTRSTTRPAIMSGYLGDMAGWTPMIPESHAEFNGGAVESALRDT